MKGYWSLAGILVLFLFLYVTVTLFTPPNRDLMSHRVRVEVLTGSGVSGRLISVDGIMEVQEMERLVKEYVSRKHPGEVFDASVEKTAGRWALGRATNIDGGPSTSVLLQKVRGHWLAVAAGAEINTWKPLAPELFVGDIGSFAP